MPDGSFSDCRWKPPRSTRVRHARRRLPRKAICGVRGVHKGERPHSCPRVGCGAKFQSREDLAKPSPVTISDGSFQGSSGEESPARPAVTSATTYEGPAEEAPASRPASPEAATTRVPWRLAPTEAKPQAARLQSYVRRASQQDPWANPKRS